MSKRKSKDRNQIVRENMAADKERKERIEHNNEVFKANEEQMKDYSDKFATLKEAFDLEQEGDMLKLSGLDVINPTFEFERSEAWKKWQEKSVKLAMKRRQITHDSTVKQLEDAIANLKEANERIKKENSELTDALDGKIVEKAEYLG